MLAFAIGGIMGISFSDEDDDCWKDDEAYDDEDDDIDWNDDEDEDRWQDDRWEDDEAYDWRQDLAESEAYEGYRKDVRC
jgi:hypothetical protein